MAIIEEVVDDENVQQKIDELKKEGNTHFGQGNFATAIEKYEEALKVCPEELKEFRSVLNSNISAAYIKLEKWDEAVVAATTAIDAGTSNDKALERRAFANQRLDKVTEAITDYKAVLEKNPARKDLFSKIAECEKRSLEIQENMKNDLLIKLKSLGNVCLKPFGLSTDSFEMTPNGEGGYSIGMKGQNKSNDSNTGE